MPVLADESQSSRIASYIHIHEWCCSNGWKNVPRLRPTNVFCNSYWAAVLSVWPDHDFACERRQRWARKALLQLPREQDFQWDLPWMRRKILLRE